VGETRAESILRLDRRFPRWLRLRDDSPAWPALTAPGHGRKNDNPNWQNVAEPWLAFLKQACPTAYTEPFDDATSTFACTSPSGAAVAHDVTFCP
jgi:hypothetical protein